MFNLSFGEVFLIIILAILFIKPSDIPSIIHNIKKAFNKFLAIKSEFMDEIEELKDDMKELEDDLRENGKIIKSEEPEEAEKPKKAKGEKDGK